MLQPIQASFFEKTSLELAKSLLGKLLVKETDQGIASGWIVETEAYIGPGDQAAHSFNNRRTKRTEVMYGPPGYVYTYVMHTHCLVNVVSGAVGQPEAVLIRAIEPYAGMGLMFERREKAKKVHDLTSGPGKLTQALGIVIEDYGRPLFERPLFIAEEGREVLEECVTASPRIGIHNSGEAKNYPWRFFIKGNPFISRKG